MLYLQGYVIATTTDIVFYTSIDNKFNETLSLS